MQKTEDRSARTAGHVGDLLRRETFDRGQKQHFPLVRSEHFEGTMKRVSLDDVRLPCGVVGDFRDRLITVDWNEQQLAALPIAVDVAAADGGEQIRLFRRCTGIDHGHTRIVNEILRLGAVVCQSERIAECRLKQWLEVLCHSAEETKMAIA